jgi:hypothetical protein
LIFREFDQIYLLSGRFILKGAVFHSTFTENGKEPCFYPQTAFELLNRPAKHTIAIPLSAELQQIDFNFKSYISRTLNPKGNPT